MKDCSYRRVQHLNHTSSLMNVCGKMEGTKDEREKGREGYSSSAKITFPAAKLSHTVVRELAPRFSSALERSLKLTLGELRMKLYLIF